MVGFSSATAIAAHRVDSMQTVSSTASSFFIGSFLLIILKSDPRSSFRMDPLPTLTLMVYAGVFRFPLAVRPLLMDNLVWIIVNIIVNVSC
jgi:hypothetical protein